VISHATKSSKKPEVDGDLSAIVVDVETGASSGVPVADRYVVEVPHKLGRVPIGVQIIMSNKNCNVFCLSKDATKIRLKFTAERCLLTLRIW
jgi:hypothetical protein